MEQMHVSDEKHLRDGDEVLYRRMDDLSRLVIPRVFTKALHMEPTGGFAITLEGDAIVLRKAETRCRLCGGSEDLLQLDLPEAPAAVICHHCRQIIASTQPR